MARASGPDRRTIPMPPRPGGVEIAAIVSSGTRGMAEVSQRPAARREVLEDSRFYAPLDTSVALIDGFLSASTPYRYGPKRVSKINDNTIAPQNPASGTV